MAGTASSEGPSLTPEPKPELGPDRIRGTTTQQAATWRPQQLLPLSSQLYPQDPSSGAQ